MAVKVQYPGAGDALLSDLSQLGRVARLFGPLIPGMDVKPLLAELRERVAEELDYALEAQAQHTHAAEFAGDPDVEVPDVVHQADQVLVTEWMDGVPLSEVISGGSQEMRDRAGQLLAHFLFAGPARTGLLHADPHPGNFRLLTDDGPASGWRLGVLDFGTVDRLPEGLPLPIGTALRLALAGDAEQVYRMLREEGFVKPTITLDADAVLDYLRPIIEPAGREEFPFDRAWMRAQAATDRRSALARPPVGQAAEPAAVVSADPPRDAEHRRRAVPVGRDGAAARGAARVAARVRPGGHGGERVGGAGRGPAAHGCAAGAALPPGGVEAALDAAQMSCARRRRRSRRAGRSPPSRSTSAASRGGWSRSEHTWSSWSEGVCDPLGDDTSGRARFVTRTHRGTGPLRTGPAVRCGDRAWSQPSAGRAPKYAGRYCITAMARARRARRATRSARRWSRRRA